MMGDREPIRGKVARVLNSRELVLNVGTKVGVGVGAVFEVLDRKGEQIVDPDSGRILGSVDRPKVRVRVTSVQDELCVASTFKKQKVNVGGQGASASAITQLFLPQRWITKYETLRTDEATWEDLDEKDSYVKTGDPVVERLNADVGSDEP